MLHCLGMKIISYFIDGPEELRRRMLRHKSTSPSCPKCILEGIDWETVEIEEHPPIGPHGLYRIKGEES